MEAGSEEQSAQAELRVAALQFDVRRGDVAANLEAVEAGLRRAAQRDVALVVLPEMWPTSFVDLEEFDTRWLPETNSALEHLRLLTEELDLMVAGSTFALGEPGQGPRNRLRIFDRGQEILSYDKVHLFTPAAEHEVFSAGLLEPPSVDTRLGRVSGGVCYDLRFPALFNGPFLERAEILVLPAQWPIIRAPHWKALLVGRAVECQAVMIGCNRTGEEFVGRRRMQLSFPGNSFVVGPHGEILAAGDGQARLVEATVDLAEMRRLRRRVPVRRDERSDLYRTWAAARET